MRSLNNNEIQSVNGAFGLLALAATAGTAFTLGGSIGAGLGYYFGFSSCTSNLLGSLGGGFSTPGPTAPVDNTQTVFALINTPGFPNNIDYTKLMGV